MVLNILTQGRSYGIQLIFATQNCSDLEKAKLSEEFMVNTPVKIVLGHDLDKKAISYIKDFLLLNDTAVKDLYTDAKGQGIIKIGDTHAPIAFIPSDEELKIIKGVNTGDMFVPSGETTAPTSDGKTEGRIKDVYVNLAKENKIVFADWIEGEDQAYNLQKAGYKPYNPQNVIGRGNVPCWVHESIIKEDGNIKNQSPDHYFTVTRWAGILMDRGFNVKKVNHSDGLDIEAEFNGEPYGFEYEYPDTHHQASLIEKKRRGMSMVKHLLFIGSKANEAMLKEAVGDEFYRRRGGQLKTWLDDQLANKKTEINIGKLDEKSEAVPSETRISEPKVEQCETNGAF
jgi:hypothetical protein